jgi:tetratricopeptide (TPR) repeat protein
MTERQIPDALHVTPARAEEILVEHFLATLHDPFLEKLIMAAALPRAFDAALLGRLTDTDSTRSDFADAFAKLVANPFVYERTDGMYFLHDSIREALLDRWRGVDDRDEHLRQLLAHYDERYRKARRLDEALAQVGAVMRRANLARWSAAAERTEDLLIRPAIEALHVALMIGLDEGWEQMKTTFREFEGESRYRLCAMLVSSWAEDADLVPDAKRAAHQGWSAYFAARLAYRREQWDEAERQLQKVERPEDIDLKLASWIYTIKSISLASQWRMNEALAALDSEIAFGDQHQIDVRNASIPWINKAHIYGQLWDQDLEIAALQEAVRRADKAQNVEARIRHQLDLVRALSIRGEFDGAAINLIDAVRTARQEQCQNLQVNLAVARCVLVTYGSHSARLLHALVTQYRQLAQLEWPSGQIDLLLMEADALGNGGNAPAAAKKLEEARQLAIEHLPERVWEVDACWAGESEALGEPLRGVEVNLALLKDPRVASDKYTQARCLTNAASELLSAGEFSRGLEYVRSGRKVWASIGHERAVNLTLAIEAELLRRLGDLENAQKVLASLTDESARGYEVERQRYAARVALDRGAYEEAAAEAQRAMQVSDRTGTRVDAVRDALLAVECLVAGRRFGEAAQVINKVDRLLSDLGTFCEWSATEKTRLADEHAARAVVIMVIGYGPDHARRRSAREHLEIATNLDPQFGWFQLELAFLELAEGRQRQAINYFAAAAQLTDDPALGKAIERMRADLEKASSHVE